MWILVIVVVVVVYYFIKVKFVFIELVFFLFGIFGNKYRVMFKIFKYFVGSF